MMYILGRVINEGYIGDIEIDGNSIEEYSIESYRKKIYVLTQKPFIFEGSLKDNVLLFHDSKDKMKL
jgi:ABC-type transport system involved in cytochrome bd biosynthesis fused ATPase/permease subunit